MGQFDSVGLPPVGRIGLSESDRGRGLPQREDQPRPGTTYVAKKKDKPKTAAAGGGMKPPNNPPKGPTGPKGPNKDKFDKGNGASNGKKTGYLDKGRKN